MVAAGKILIVSGEPRSGTSLMMKTLETLGIDIAGETFPGISRLSKAAESASGKRKEKLQDRLTKMESTTKKLNPGGFYEIPGVVMRGIRKVDDDTSGKAVKIITPGLMERVLPSGQTVGTPMDLVDKVIFCLRNPKNVSLSQTNLDSSVEIRGLGQEWENFRNPISPMRYVTHMGSFANWFANQPDEIRSKFKFIDYDNFIDNPQATVDAITSHIGYTPSAAQISDAVGNVDESLRRSTEFAGWPEKLQIEGDLAVRIYGAMKSGDTAQAVVVATETQEILHNMALESVRWTDEETWVDVNPSLYRSMLTDDNNVKTKLLESLTEKRDNDLIPDACRYYSRDTENTYNVARPSDLGTLTRPTVKCARDNDNKPLEQCKVCWQRGWMVNNKPVGPQMRA